MSVASVGRAGVLERLRAALIEERDGLVQYAEEVRGWIDQEADDAHQEQVTATVDKPPPLAEMRLYSERLQGQYLQPDGLDAIFGRQPDDSRRTPLAAPASPLMPVILVPGQARPPASIAAPFEAMPLSQQQVPSVVAPSTGAGAASAAATGADSSRVARVDRLRNAVQENRSSLAAV